MVEVVFEASSEANFTRPYTSCGFLPLLEDKIAFEGEENFTVSILPPSIGTELGENSTATVIILDNDGK